VQQRRQQQLLSSANKSADPINLLFGTILGPPRIRVTAHQTFSLKQRIDRFRHKGLPMTKVKYISSLNEIPAGQQYVLVVYGEEYAETKHPLGLTVTAASSVSQLSFLTAIHTAKGIAKHAGISEIFVCAAMTPAPNPTPSGMFTYVPAQDDLSSNVVGVDVYNEGRQNIGTIKDIALDASGLYGYIVSVGRFLGMGDHYVVVRPSAISLEANDDKWHAKMNVNADQLKTAPEYKYSSKS
jgi:hypothetical protein